MQVQKPGANRIARCISLLLRMGAFIMHVDLIYPMSLMTIWLSLRQAMPFVSWTTIPTLSLTRSVASCFRHYERETQVLVGVLEHLWPESLASTRVWSFYCRIHPPTRLIEW